MTNPLDVLRTESAVIVQSPWSFAICLLVVAGVIYAVLRSMKAQEIGDLHSRLALRKDEIEAYRRQLDGASPEQAKARLDALEATVARLQPRRLSAEQQDGIRSAIASSPSVVTIGGSEEARQLRSDFIAVFESAGWSVRNGGGGPGYPEAARTGLGVRVQDPATLTLLQTAFVNALHAHGVDFDLGQGEHQPGRGKQASEILLQISTPER